MFKKDGKEIFMTNERKAALFEELLDIIAADSVSKEAFIYTLRCCGMDNEEISSCIHIKSCTCPLGGDETDDCSGCAYSGDYHYENGECVKRNELRYTTIPHGVVRAKKLCHNCRKVTIFHKLDFNYFPDRSHLYANGYCEECGKLQCNLEIWGQDIVEVYKP